jgi:Holliday junction DNA helicase RuvA
MIDILCGNITHITEDAITVMTGGIGFRLHVPQVHIFTISSAVTLYAYLHWNQENGPSLFGFSTELDRQVFLLIISCSGIGPKIALSILGSLGSSGCIHAVCQGDDKALSKVPGIGTKKAEQIIVSLKHKMQKLLKSGIELEDVTALHHMHELNDVLTSLNYSKREIDATLHWLSEQPLSEPVPFDKLMRQALSFLAKKA